MNNYMPLSNQKDKLYTLVGILLALFLSALDQTIVSTALPRIVEDLQGINRFSWVATAYLVASTALVPIYGKLADMYSRRKIELYAIVIFLAGSFLCGLAGEFSTLPLLGDGMDQLIIFRAIQGMGGAGLFAMAFIIIADLFPPAERGKYQGFVGAVFGISSVLGPWVGGLLTDYGSNIIPGVAGWRWVFYVNVPFGALALWFIITRMPPLLPAGQKGRLDYVTAILLIGALVPLVLGLQLDKSIYPWTSPVTIGLFVLAVVCMFLFSMRSLRSLNPILDFSLFRSKVFNTSIVALFLLGAAFFSIVIFIPLYVVNVVGVSATKAGVSLIPLSLGLVFGSVVAGQLVSRFGHYRLWMLIGGIILMIGMVLLSLMTVQTPYWHVPTFMLICGLGMGPSMPLYTLAVQNAVDMRKIGQATSATQFFRQIGGAIGAALMGTLFATTLTLSFASLMPVPIPGLDLTSQSQVSEGSVPSIGESNNKQKIQQLYNKHYALIERVVLNNDRQAMQEVLNDPYLSENYQEQLRASAITAQSLPAVKKQLAQQAAGLDQRITEGVREAFTKAITSIYFYTIFVVAASFIVTWFIPELPLRKTNEPIPVINE
jgi:EmrB/QacA subfamily drug resistance transporter